MDDGLDGSDGGFEPQQRARSNTWPLPRPDNYVDGKDEGGGVSGGVSGGLLLLGADGCSKPPDQGGQMPKKNSSRRNAWGNMSYADLITQAIQSSADKRLTLSQIYDWMVQNVPYFKDKGDSNSSAGWKNSIRHNLSLHNRFMRVQNEGTGKSSWWMINPDAKPGKAARRRATSMETQKYEKKRGRIKKKVEALRNGLLQPDAGTGAAATPSPSSSISESLDMFPESPLHSAAGFQLSPDFRQRAGSNASSCGRLSPILGIEADMHDSQVPPMSPTWESTGNLVALYTNDRYGTDQLVDTLTETMKLGGGSDAYLTECGMKGSPGAPNGGQLSPHLHSLQQSPSNGYSLYSSPGSRYSDYSPSSYGGQNEAPKLSPQRLLGDSLNGPSSYNIASIQALSPAHSVHSLSPPSSADALPLSQPSPSAQHVGGPEPVLSPHSSAYPTSATAAAAASPSAYCALSPSGGAASGLTPAASAMLRAALSPSPHKEAAQRLATAMLAPVPSSSQSVSQMMGQLLAINNGMPTDLDLSMDALQGGLECDVDQVISHELSVDGNLDFNFQAEVPGAQTHPTAAGGRHWVH